MGAIDAHLRKLLPSSFVCLVQRQAGEALSLETSSTIVLRPAKSTKHIRFSKKIILFLLFLVLNQYYLCLIG